MSISTVPSTLRRAETPGKNEPDPDGKVKKLLVHHRRLPLVRLGAPAGQSGIGGVDTRGITQVQFG